MMGRMLRRGIGHTLAIGLFAGAIVATAFLAPAAAVAPLDDVVPTDSASPAPTDPAASPAPTDPAASPTPTPTPKPDAAIPPPLVMPAQLGSWCTTLFPPYKAKVEKRKAQELMAGKVDMDEGGTYYLSQHPNWRPQSGTDTSGDRHVNSLDWALPLLYRGVHKQNPALIERFRQILYYWIDDHRGSRAYWVDGSIYGGLRTQTLVCAAQTLNEPTLTAAVQRDAAKMVSGYRVPPLIAVGANNTDLHRQTGAFATYCWLNDTGMRDRAWANIVGVANGVVHPDGSDVEGSPGYAMYIEKLLSDVMAAASTCGLQSDNIAAMRQSLYTFVAQAVRPDFKLESLGDTINESLRGTFGIGDGTAEWIRSAGTAGSPSAPIYSTFNGGYAFGRSGWQPAAGGPDSFYSLRYSSNRPATPHTHDDGAALTFFSKGVEWIGDPGPYRYDNGSSLRWYMVSRAAHSSVTVSNVSRTKSNGVRLASTRSDWSTGGNDYTCIADRTWGSVGVTRCVTYVRSVDALIVADYVSGTKSKAKRVVTERWQVEPGVGATNANDVMTLSAGDKRLDIIKSGPGSWGWRAARSGSNTGWFTGAWGQKLPGEVLSRAVPISKSGAPQTLITVFVPRLDGENVPVVVDANGITITRNGQTITTPVPAPF